MKRSSRSELPSMRRNTKSPRPRAILTAVVLIGVATLVGMFAARRFSDPHETIGTTLTQMFNPIPAPQVLFHKDRLSILLLGIDYSYSDKDQEYSAGARSDTIMAMSLDLPSQSLHVLSVPRDMEYTFADGHTDKINAAYSVGGAHGAEKAVATFLGLPGFDRYLVLRINATKALIDAIGGIDVPVTETLNYDDSWGHLHIHFTPGLTHMNGEQAVSYSRFRHDACSDPCRIKRQQQVLRITIAKLKNDKINDLSHLQQLIDVVNQNVQTDLSTQEKLSLASAYVSFNMAALKSDQVPYVDNRTVANGGDVLVPDEAMKTKLVHDLFLAEIDPPALPPDPSAIAAIEPQHVHVQIENGSGVRGLGRSVGDRLLHVGYRLDHIGNAATFDHETTEIHVGVNNALVGERVKHDLGIATAAVSMDGDAASSQTQLARIVVGRDVLAGAPTSSR